MTTLQLPEEEITRHPPGSAGGGQRRLPWLRGTAGPTRRSGPGGGGPCWCGASTLAALLAQDPGRMTFDTKLGVNIDPVGFYQRLWHLWNPLEWLGSLQDQYIGYAFPMGVFYLTAHALHVPVWVAERIWMSLLVTVALPRAWSGWPRRSGIGTRPTRLLAGAAFALWPTFTILIGSTSAAVLPGVLAPWAVLPLIRGPLGPAGRGRLGPDRGLHGRRQRDGDPGRAGAARDVHATRPGRRRWELAAWWAPAVLLATSWWLVPLLYQGRYGFNFLPYIEQAANTTQTMSAAAALRGSGNWVAYLNFGLPWLTAGSVVVGLGWAVAAAALAAATGLAGLARRDLPEALWLRATVAVAALWALTGYSGPLGAPLHRTGPGPAERYAVGAAQRVQDRAGAGRGAGAGHRARPGARPYGGGGWPGSPARVAAVAALAGLALPYLSGQALQPGSFTQVPAYWRQAASWLAAHHGTETTLVVPADAHGIYTWGQPIDEPLEPLASSPWVQAQPGALHRRRNQRPGDRGRAGDRVGDGHAGPGRRTWRGPGSATSWCATTWIPAQIGYTPPTAGARRAARLGIHPGGGLRPAGAGWPPPAWGRPCRYRRSQPVYPPVEIFQAANPADQASAARRPCCPPPRPRSSTAAPPRCCSWRARACWAPGPP